MEYITLECINIKKLFNRFDYEIDLRNGEDVSILIAPNGCGKTTIFSLITFIFKPTIQGYRRIQKIPFDECECVLSNGKRLVLRSKETKKPSSRAEAYLENYRKMVRNSLDMGAEIKNRELTLSVDGVVINYSKEIDKLQTKMTPDYFAYMDELDSSEGSLVEIRPRERAMIEQTERFTAEIVDTLDKHSAYLSVNFITADRLHSGNGASHWNRYMNRSMEYGTQEAVKDPIRKAQEDTLDRYRRIREKYAELQSKVKDELPQRYLKVDEPLWEYEEFEKRWKDYVKDIEKYYEIGLLDSADTILNVKQLKDHYRNKGAFLTVYLDAFSKTLKPLEEHYAKLKLFADIFNQRNRVTRKTISYGKKGIILRVNGEELPLDCLSSGEKNDFVMFFDLIFNTKRDGLVLIDEPEISLHIEWQQTFLDALVEICTLNGLQSIVATHSPNIINGHRELFAERGIEYEAERD